MSLGERVEQRIQELGLNQSELARRVGLTQPAIYALINRNKTGSKNLHRIARELQTTPAYLSGDTDDPDDGAPPPPHLTHDESKLLSNWRMLSAEDRKALDRIVNAMVGPKTIHAPQLSYRAGDGV